MRAIRFLAFAFALAALLPAAVWAQFPPGLNITATVGFDGFQRPGAWTPIFVTMDNQSSGTASAADFRGFLQIECAPHSDGAPVRFTQAVDLPVSARKIFTLFARFPEVGNTPPPLELTAENGRRLARITVDVKNVPRTNLLLGVVSSDVERVYLPMMRDGLDRFLRARVDPELFPESWVGLDSLDVIVMPQWPRGGLSGPGLQALQDWVQMGGTLVMLGGQRTMGWSEAAAKELLPVELSGVSRLVERGDRLEVVNGTAPLVAKERNFVISDATALPGTTELVSIGGKGLLFRADRGLGQVLFFANDLQAGEVGSQASSLLLDRVLRPAWFAAMPLPNMAGPEDEFPQALQDLSLLTGRSARPPNAVLMILMLVIYAVLVGPVNFLGLRKLGKLEWAWATTPALVFVFFGLIYGLGKATRSGEGILREMDVQRFRAGDPNGASMQVTAGFTHEQGRYFFKPLVPRNALGDAAKWFPLDDIRRSFRQGGVSLTELPLRSTQQTDPKTGVTYISAQEMATHDLSTFITRGPVSLSGAIEGSARWVGGNSLIEATVKNGAEAEFEQSWVMFGGRMIELGSVAAGATKSTLGGRSGWLGMNGVLDEFAEEVSDEEAAASRKNFALVMKASFMPKASGAAFPVDRGTVWFVGYRSGVENRSTIDNLPKGTRSRAEAVLVRLPLEAPSTEFRVPPEALSLRLVNSGLQGHGSDDFEFENNLQLGIQSSFAIFALDLPFDVSRSAFLKRLRAEVVTDKVPGGSDVALEVYNLEGDRLWLPPADKDGTTLVELTGVMQRTRRIFVRLGVEDKPPGKDGEIQLGEKQLFMKRLDINLQGGGP